MISAIGSFAETPTQASFPPGTRMPPLTAQVVPGSDSQVTVVFVTRVINRGETSLVKPAIIMHTPVTLPHQEITELQVEGSPERLTDRWGAPVLRYQRQDLAPGTNLAGRWTAWATIRRFRWDWDQEPQNGSSALTPEEGQLYLRDDKNLALTDPVVCAAADEAASGKNGATEILDGAFGLVMDRLSYDRDGKWQPAPEVLTSGKGSCSEYTYCFMALCRKNGIPARYAGGIVGRANTPVHVDKIFHRFPQAWLPGRGWVDFDPTRTERAKNKRLYFGQTPGPMLLLSVGDGGEGSLTGADYLESHYWQNKGAKATSHRQAWWFPPPSAKVRLKVEEFRRGLASTNEDRSALVDQAVSIGHPFVLPWLDDLLYETGTRVAAARACLQIGGEAELVPVVNCLERLDDPEGDRQIGELLEGFTGEKRGSSRAGWNEWLKARTPRTPLPGDLPATSS